MTREVSAREFYTFAHPPERFALENGEGLGPVTVAYETYGRLNKAGDNAIVICHALTGDSHVASHGAGDTGEGWWENFVGPGRPVDTQRYFVVCANVLGGCQGATGPSSTNPATGLPYAMTFPTVTVRDMVRVQKRLLDHLGVKRLLAAIGGSMGGMQVLEWARSYPDFLEMAIPIASPARHSPQAIALGEVGRQAIMRDPKWRNGNYYPGKGPTDGLAVARMLGMITYESEAAMLTKFGRRMDVEPTVFGGSFQVERYLAYQGEKLVKRFDANSYLYLLRAMDLFDLTEGLFSLVEAVRTIKARVLVVGISSDILYPTWQQKELVEALRKAGVVAFYREVDSIYGHDAFLVEPEKMAPWIADFLGGYGKNFLAAGIWPAAGEKKEVI
ncbi:MAG: homoserine O-acetyltransferase [Firmicutes bacterium]|nr:homoserine O-acetyltransferase [Bacillota bacterium]